MNKKSLAIIIVTFLSLNAQADWNATCQKAVSESHDTMDTYLGVARKNLQGGYITQANFDQVDTMFKELKLTATTAKCNSSTGNNKAFFECLATNYGDVMNCGQKHRPDFN